MGVLGASSAFWGRLGGVWGRLGSVWGASWSVLGRLGDVLGASWGRLGASCGTVLNMKKRLKDPPDRQPPKIIEKSIVFLGFCCFSGGGRRQGELPAGRGMASTLWASGHGPGTLAQAVGLDHLYFVFRGTIMMFHVPVTGKFSRNAPELRIPWPSRVCFQGRCKTRLWIVPKKFPEVPRTSKRDLWF